MKLVIVESPSKVKPIQKYLKSIDKDIVVAASGGHIRRLANSGIGRFGVDIENGFAPKFVNEKTKEKFIKNLQKEAKKADEIYLATDPDREGEAIAYHVLEVLKFDHQKAKRITYNQITKSAVIDAYNHPSELNQNLIKSQFTRQILDKIMGFSLSRVIQRKIKSQSAGRVQSVALKIVSERELEILNFVPVKYFDLNVEFEKEKNNICANLIKLDNKKLDITKDFAIFTKKQALSIEEELKKGTLKVSSYKESTQLSNPKAPFQTSTLQQAASSLLGFSPKKTMQVAQKLYEGKQINKNHVGLITYMRTDSNEISLFAKEEIQNYIANNYSSSLVSKVPMYKSKKSANSQEAHEGIRPVDVNLNPGQLKEILSSDEYKLYNLIWKRTVCAFMTPASYYVRSLTLENTKYTFSTSGRVLKTPGYLTIYDEFVKNEDTLLPEFKVGEIIDPYKINLKENETKPPRRYSEASLVKKLEELGIGRPSTFASVLDTLKLRDYINIEKRAINVTEKGLRTNKILQEFFNKLINEQYTANMEKYLDEIANGNIVWNSKLKEFYYDELKPLVDNAMENAEKLGDEKVGRLCPECNNDLVYKLTRWGVKFIGCSSYPECKYTESITTNIICPKCKKGKITPLKSKRGKEFFVCSNKDCDLITWNIPTEQQCEICSSYLTIDPKDEKIVRCENKECSNKGKKILRIINKNEEN